MEYKLISKIKQQFSGCRAVIFTRGSSVSCPCVPTKVSWSSSPFQGSAGSAEHDSIPPRQSQDPEERAEGRHSDIGAPGRMPIAHGDTPLVAFTCPFCACLLLAKALPLHFVLLMTGDGELEEKTQSVHISKVHKTPVSKRVRQLL